MSTIARRAVFRRRVAYHEAGHAVAAALLRRPFRYITIRPNGKLKGHMAWSMTRERKRRTPPLVQAVVALAGPIAEARHKRRLFTNLIRGTDEELIFGSGLSRAMLVRALESAIHVVAFFWREIRAVARALQQDRTLNELAVVKLMALSLKDSMA